MPISVVRPDGRSDNIGLRAATGMLDFDIAKLEYDPESRVVTFAADFNPDTDVRVIDIMRPRGWARVDANGYPERSSPSVKENADARQSLIRHTEEFEGTSTGYFGSVACLADANRNICMFAPWSTFSGVAVVSFESCV